MNKSSPFKPDATPDVLAQDIHPGSGRVQLVRLTEDQYRAASFLDQRILTPGVQSHWADWHEVASAAHALPAKPGPDIIFHIGHVGSTLLSRILGDHPAIFSSREPSWLRTLVSDYPGDAFAGAPDAVWVLTKLAGRTYRQSQRALVKATSFASEIAPLFVPAAPSARVIGLVASPQIHMATLLAGEHSMVEVDALGPGRLARIQRRAAGFQAAWPALGTGEKLAATWLAEMLSLSQALSLTGPAGLVVDFDAFLQDIPAALHGLLIHLHGRVDAQAVDALANSSHFGRYSKAQSHEYSPQLRQEVLAHTWRDHGEILRPGMAWLGAQLRRYPELARILGPFLSA